MRLIGSNGMHKAAGRVARLPAAQLRAMLRVARVRIRFDRHDLGALAYARTIETHLRRRERLDWMRTGHRPPEDLLVQEEQDPSERAAIARALHSWSTHAEER